MTTPPIAVSPPPARARRWYSSLWVQVTVGIVLAVSFMATARIGLSAPKIAFIRLITMIITLMIFCTVVTGIAGMRDLRKVGRVGGKALLYFEVVSTLALVVGLIVGNVVHPGSGFNVNAATLDARAVADYAGQAKTQTVTDFLMRIIPITIVDAFAKLPPMRQASSGRIIAIGSRAAENPGAMVGAYSASKAALVSLIRTVAIENKALGITANLILPGTTDTPANRKDMPGADTSQWVRPASVASLIVWLAGNGGKDVTGAVRRFRYMALGCSSIRKSRHHTGLSS